VRLLDQPDALVVRRERADAVTPGQQADGGVRLIGLLDHAHTPTFYGMRTMSGDLDQPSKKLTHRDFPGAVEM
jgi:hypothetical protein